MPQENIQFPRHIAFIMDGNRRWAKKKGLAGFKGHYVGAQTLENLITQLAKLEQIPYFTFWGGSVNNLTVRPKQEIKALFDVYEKWFAKLLERKELVEKDIRVRIVGNWKGLAPKGLSDTFEKLINQTENHKKFNLTFLIAYSGKEEMLAAITEIKNQNSKTKVSESELLKNLWTGDLPPVDLVIRTGIDQNDAPHWSSGFMMWLCADAQLYFTRTLWPDFSAKEFARVLKIYGETQRRFGK